MPGHNDQVETTPAVLPHNKASTNAVANHERITRDFRVTVRDVCVSGPLSLLRGNG